MSDAVVAKPASPGRRRPGGPRSGERQQLPYAPARLAYRPLEIVSADALEAIHQAALTILAEIGLVFLLPEARAVLRDAGAEVAPDGRVRFAPALVEGLVAKAPARFTIHARNPAHDVRFGDGTVNFCSVGGAPNAHDAERGRRAGNFADFQDFVRLSQQANALQLVAGYPLEPIDLEPHRRHLIAGQAMARLCDKPLFAIPLGRRRILDGLEIARIVHGLAPEALPGRPIVFVNINANSPLQYDVPMLWTMLELARAGQPVIVTPFTLAGAMAPVTLAGALAQQHAEALAGIALLQAVRPGTPAIYGAFTSNVDLRSGAPAFGTPEATQAALISGQLARRLGIPWRASNVNAAVRADAQAAWESMMSLWGAILGGASVVVHAAGWLEGGLVASFEKFAQDLEMLQHMTRFLAPPLVDQGTLALDAIREVGPGGHFFGCQHTLARYETAFYAPLLSDWRGEAAWLEAGGQDTAQRALALAKRLLADYREPMLEPAVDAALEAFVQHRLEQGGATQDDL